MGIMRRKKECSVWGRDIRSKGMDLSLSERWELVKDDLVRTIRKAILAAGRRGQ